MVALLAWIIRGALSDFDIERKAIDYIKKEFLESDVLNKVSVNS